MPDFLLPVLSSLQDGATITRTDLSSRAAAVLQLSSDEIAERTTRGDKTKLQDRVHWAAYYLNRAGLISLHSSRFTITPRGTEYLRRGKHVISKQDLKEFPEYVNFLAQVRRGKRELDSTIHAGMEDSEFDQTTPMERIRASYVEVQQQTKDELLQRVLDNTPAFFEHLVKDLLIAMGYGWAPEAGQVVGKSGDGGIDVVLSLDRLGLTKVYVQAKRWQANIGAGELRDFVGALTAHNVKSGVFISTSAFQANAAEYLQRIPHEVALIDGDRLAELCLEFGVGVTTAETLVIRRLDNGYFEV